MRLSKKIRDAVDDKEELFTTSNYSSSQPIVSAVRSKKTNFPTSSTLTDDDQPNDVWGEKNGLGRLLLCGHQLMAIAMSNMTAVNHHVVLRAFGNIWMELIQLLTFEDIMPLYTYEYNIIFNPECYLWMLWSECDSHVCFKNVKM